MAKTKGGIQGLLSGKIGNLVWSTWKGIPYVRAMPDESKKKKKRSPAQIANQEKFNFVNQLLVPFHPFITVGFANNAVNQTEISAAFSVNYRQAIIGVYPDLSVDYSKLVLSMGKLPRLEEAFMERIAEDTIKLNWAQNDSMDAIFNDQLMLVLYCPELKLTDGFVGGVKRTAKECIFQFNQKMAGKPLEVYASFTSLNRREVANSLYLGTL